MRCAQSDLRKSLIISRLSARAYVWWVDPSQVGTRSVAGLRFWDSSAKLCVLAITLGEVGFAATNLAHLNAIVRASGPHPLGEDGHRKTNLAQINRL